MTTRNKFWHELSEDEIKTLRKGKRRFLFWRKRLTWGEVMIMHPQPLWCNYPEAVCGVMGCWSLIGIGGEDRRIRKIEDCEGCDLLEAIPYDPKTVCSSIR